MDIYNRQWITENAIDIIGRYEDGELTLRALHYQLVGRGMTNTQQHYKRVVKAMEVARWDGAVTFETFSDLDREVVGKTYADATDLDSSVSDAKHAIKQWMQLYFKNRWENQDIYPEVWIEKKALQNVFAPVCERNNVALAPCKGYPSLTFLNEAAGRFMEREAEGKECVILYFGDYDPSGEDIPRSVGDNLARLGATVEVKRYALTEEQVRAWKLPPAPAKTTDSRTANWDGLGQVELDAVDLHQLRDLAQQAIDEHFDRDAYDDLMRTQETERAEYITQLKDYVQGL